VLGWWIFIGVGLALVLAIVVTAFLLARSERRVP
jgi:hypothetical protein